MCMLVNRNYVWILHNWWRSPSIWGECLVHVTTSTLALVHCYIHVYSNIMLLVIKVPILALHWPKIPAQHCDTEVELHLLPPIRQTDTSHSWQHIPCSILGSHLQNQAVTSCLVSFPMRKVTNGVNKEVFFYTKYHHLICDFKRLQLKY